MKISALLVLMNMMVGGVLGYAEPINIDNGTLKMGGILHTSVTFGEDTARASFSMDRARFLFWGMIVPDKVKYFIQTEAVQGTTTVNPFLLDTKISFFFLPQTEVMVGRFLPAFSSYMPRPVSKLELINYPLFVYTYAMWRQVGLQTTTQTEYGDFTFGLFNGYPSNNWADNNYGKDVLFSATAKLADFVKAFGYGWAGSLLGPDLKKNRLGGGISLNKNLGEGSTIIFNGELIGGADEAAGGYTSSFGYYAHVGFAFDSQFEVLARYDNMDSNTQDNTDAIYWLTLGVNYRIKGDNAKIAVNYIMKREPGVETNNDLLVTQFQVAF